MVYTFANALMFMASKSRVQATDLKLSDSKSVVQATDESFVEKAEGFIEEHEGVIKKTINVGKAVAGIAVGAIVIVGSGVLEVGSGGTATPLMALTASFGANSIANGCRDLWYSGTGQGDKSGKKDFLRDGTSTVTGAFGKLAGHEEVGKIVGETSYYALDVVTCYAGIKKAFNTVKAVDYVKTTCFKASVGNNIAGYVDEPIKMLVEENSGKCAKAISSYKLVSNAKKVWDRANKVYDKSTQLNNAQKE